MGAPPPGVKGALESPLRGEKAGGPRGPGTSCSPWWGGLSPAAREGGLPLLTPTRGLLCVLGPQRAGDDGPGVR